MKTSKDNLIHIDTKYAIQGDGVGVILYGKRIVKKTGEMQLDPVGYFPSLTQALFRLLERDLGERRSLQAVIDGMDEHKKWLQNSIFSLQSGDKKLEGMQLFSLRLKCLECADFRKT